MKSFSNSIAVFIKKTTYAIFFCGFMTFFFLAVIGRVEASAPPCWQTLNENIDIYYIRKFTQRAWPFYFFQEPFSYWNDGIIEFSSFVTSERQPMTQAKPDKKRKQSEKLSVLSDSLKDIFIEHGILWLGSFIAGLICGGAFGWPPFSRT